MAEIAVAVSAVLGLVISVLSMSQARQANQIAMRASEPQITLVQHRTSVGSYDPTSQTTFCRERVLFFNSGQSTAVVAVKTLVLFSDSVVPLMTYGPPTAYWDEQSGTDIVINVWTTPPPDTDLLGSKPLYERALLAQGTRLPARLEGHTATELFVDFTARFRKARPQTVAALYVAQFPDTSPVGTGRVDLCLNGR